MECCIWSRIDLESRPRDTRAQFYAEAEKLRRQALEAGFAPGQDAASLRQYASLQMLRAAMIASRRGDATQVERNIRAAHRLAPDIITDSDGLVSRARLISVDALLKNAHELSARAGSEDLTLAINLCNQALVLDPYSSAIYFVRGTAFFRSGDKVTAEKDWLRSIELSKTGPFGTSDVVDNALAKSHYNLVRTYALRSAAAQDASDQRQLVATAINHLESAVRAGLEPLDVIRTDSDLDALRGDPMFLEILKHIP